jgi:glutamyl-tRNA reductase
VTRERELAELAQALSTSVDAAREHAAIELAQLHALRQQAPDDPGAHATWTLRCCNQAEAYFDTVEHADSLSVDLAQVLAQLDALRATAA